MPMHVEKKSGKEGGIRLVITKDDQTIEFTLAEYAEMVWAFSGDGSPTQGNKIMNWVDQDEACFYNWVNQDEE